MWKNIVLIYENIKKFKIKPIVIKILDCFISNTKIIKFLKFLKILVTIIV